MALSVDIEKRLGTFTLKVAFEAGDGVTALLGASGSGKSLTCRCIAGIEKPDRGRIVLDGRVLYDPIITYPPGTPIVCPGEIMSMEVIGYIQNLLSEGNRISGVDEEGMIKVGTGY